MGSRRVARDGIGAIGRQREALLACFWTEKGHPRGHVQHRSDRMPAAAMSTPHPAQNPADRRVGTE